MILWTCCGHVESKYTWDVLGCWLRLPYSNTGGAYVKACIGTVSSNKGSLYSSKVRTLTFMLWTMITLTCYLLLIYIQKRPLNALYGQRFESPGGLHVELLIVNKSKKNEDEKHHMHAPVLQTYRHKCVYVSIYTHILLHCHWCYCISIVFYIISTIYTLNLLSYSMRLWANHLDCDCCVVHS